MLSLVLLVCAMCVVYLWLKYCRLKSSSHALPPAVPGMLPVIGFAYRLLKSRTDLFELVESLSQNCAKQGGVTYFNLGKELYYLIHDPQDALTAANSCSQKHYAFDFLKPWIGDGLVGSSGDIWRRHRKLLNPAFSLPVIHGFLDVFNSQSRKLASSVEHHAGKGPFNHLPYLQIEAFEALCGPFNHLPYLQIEAFEALCAGTFGIDAINDMEFMQRYKESIIEIIHIAFSRVIKFWLQNDLVYRLVGLQKKEDKIVEILHSMSNTVLQKKKDDIIRDEILNKNNEPETSGTRFKSFLDLLLELLKTGALTDIEVREELDTIMAAGFETTSNQLTYILLQLGAHPEVQQKVYEELLQVLGVERSVVKEDLNKLVYTNAVIMESLRTMPSVPALFKYADRDVELKNYTVRAGSYCMMIPLAAHLDSSWGPDSDQFIPERWLDGDFINKEFAAFGLGKRACIGRTYAMISMKVTLAHFIRQYRVTADMSKLKMTYEFVTRPASGHEISIERRS